MKCHTKIPFRGIYQLIEAYMLSLQSGPNGDRLRQQVMAVSRDADDEECVSTDEQQLCNVDESAGQVVYHLEYCLDKFAMTYKTQVLYPEPKKSRRVVSVFVTSGVCVCVWVELE